jgi:hypothetical protein
MIETIRQIPLPASLLSDPIASEIDYEAWERADTLTFAGLQRPISKLITNFYYFGYYKAQIYNGGHSQLLHNMDLGKIRSPNLIEGFIAGAKEVGASEFTKLGIDFQYWLRDNPIEVLKQAGFEGKCAEFLDGLDNRFYELDESLRPKLIELREQNLDKHELKVLNCLFDEDSHSEHFLDALEIIWLLRSGIILPIPDDLYDDTWNSMLAYHS